MCGWKYFWCGWIRRVWVCDLRVFLDRWRQMREGPTLLKERRYLRKDATEQMRECFRPRSGLAPPLFWSFC